VQVAEAADHPYSLSFGLHALSGVHRRRGDFPRATPVRATPVLEQYLNLCRTWQFVDVTPVAAAALGAAYALSGRADEALAVVADIVEKVRSHQIYVRPYFFLRCGDIYLSAGRIDEATSHAREALALSRRLGARGHEAYALRLAGDVASASGAADAEGSYREALALAKPRGMRPLIAHCHLGLGKLHRRTGNREQAQQHLTTAKEMYHEMGMTHRLAQAEAELRELG